MGGKSDLFFCSNFADTDQEVVTIAVLHQWPLCLACAVLGYLLGNVQFAVLISRLKYRDDVRNHGSGNAGSTNMLRVFGLRSGLATFLGDLLKGMLGVLVGRWIAGDAGGYVCALFVVLGHDFPVFLGFKGGKGVAASLGVIWMIRPLYGLFVTLAAVVIILLFHMISVASMAGSVLFLLLAMILDWGNWLLISLAFLLWALLLVRHWENILRLARGEENKIVLGKEDGAPPDSKK